MERIPLGVSPGGEVGEPGAVADAGVAVWSVERKALVAESS